MLLSSSATSRGHIFKALVGELTEEYSKLEHQLQELHVERGLLQKTIDEANLQLYRSDSFVPEERFQDDKAIPSSPLSVRDEEAIPITLAVTPVAVATPRLLQPEHCSSKGCCVSEEFSTTALAPMGPGPSSGIQSIAGEELPKVRSGGTSVRQTSRANSRRVSHSQELQLLDIWGQMEEIVLAPFDDAPNGRTISYRGRLRRAKTGDRLIEAESSLQWLVVSPATTCRLIWDILSVITVLYDLICIPLEAFDSDFRKTLYTLDWMTTVFWCLDIPASCLTGYYTDGVIEMRLTHIMRNYFRTWFCVDIATVLADLTILVLSTEQIGGLGVLRVNKTVRLVRVLRFIRLTRLSKLRRLLHELIDKIQSQKLRILASVMLLLASIVLINHYIACGWYAIGDANWDDSEMTWVIAQRMKTTQDSLVYWYFTSMHWSLTQFTPASMEVYAYSVIERVYSVFVLLFALVAFSSFISSITGSMTLLRQLQQEGVQQQAILRTFFLENKISAELFREIWAYLRKHHLGKKKRLQEKDIPILGKLPEHLLMKMHEELYLPELMKSPLLDTYTKICPLGAREICHRAVTMRTLTTGETVFLEGQPATCMYIAIGPLKYTRTLMMASDNSQPQNHHRNSWQGMVHQCSVAQGKWIAEASLWMNWTHCGRLVCEGVVPVGGQAFCEVMQLNALTFRNIATSEIHVSARPLVRRYAQLFATRVIELGEEGKTDLGLTYPLLRRIVQDAEIEINPPTPNTVPAEPKSPLRMPFSRSKAGNGSGADTSPGLWHSSQSALSRRLSWG